MQTERPRAIAAGFVIALSLVAAQPTAIVRAAQAKPEVIEAGRFKLHLFEMPAGEETYEITRQGDSLVLKSIFEYTDRGNKVPLSATLRMRPELMPVQFDIKGNTSAFSELDTSVNVEGRFAIVREGERSRQVSVPDRFFTLASYAPISVQMMLLRYWAAGDIKTALKTLPGGEVMIEDRGRDTIEISGRQIDLERYAVSGVIWGRESLWLDSAKQLIAVTTFDPLLNPIDAVRDGYESALATFLAKAAEDGIANLTRLGERMSPVRKGALAIVGATLVDGRGAKPLTDAAVVVEGNRIVAAGRRVEINIPKDAEIVDGRGKTVLPGLWDMHAHHDQVEWGPVYLAAGVTTVRDCGNLVEFKLALRQAIQSGRGLGPQLLLAGLVDGVGPNAIGPIRVKAPEEALSVVNRFKQAGFEQVKIYNSVKPELVPVITAEAHRLGMTVTGHVPEGMDAFQAVEAGMDQINHIAFIPPVMLSENDRIRLERLSGDDVLLRLSSMVSAVRLDSAEAKQAVQFFKDHATVIDPTLSGFELMVHTKSTPVAAFEPGIAKVAPELAPHLNNTGMPSDQARPHQKAFRNALSIVGALHSVGVPIVAGTDEVVPGHSLHRELELYVQAGFTPMEAIQAATIVPARAMKLDNEVGTIESGKRADLIIVDGNPLENISNIRKVKTVISNGRRYECAKLWESVGFKP
jgi:imidazolonepropionase-like amidohydrolase